jgi:hypothetical protein
MVWPAFRGDGHLLDLALCSCGQQANALGRQGLRDIVVAGPSSIKYLRHATRRREASLQAAQ